MAEIIIKPLITEKLNALGESQNKYGFKVDKNSTKAQIKQAIESLYEVSVTQVNTMIVASKNKTKMTKTGLVVGRKSGYKKAIVTVAEGQTIELFNEI